MQWNCMYLFLNHLTVVVYYWRNQKVSVIRLVLIIGIFVWLFTAIHIFYRCTTLIDDHIQIVCLLLLPYPFGETTFLFSLFVNKLEQKRNDNSGLNFYREWAAFRDGFGHIEADFWLGNEALHNLTKAVGNILLKKNSVAQCKSLWFILQLFILLIVLDPSVTRLSNSFDYIIEQKKQVWLQGYPPRSIVLRLLARY